MLATFHGEAPFWLIYTVSCAVPLKLPAIKLMAPLPIVAFWVIFSPCICLVLWLNVILSSNMSTSMGVGSYPLLSWRRRGAEGPGLLVDPVLYQWGAPGSHVDNPSHVLCFYRDELDKMHVDQVVWLPYSKRILRDYSSAFHESEL